MRLYEAQRKLASAIEDPGPYPGYHREAIQKLQREWPTLWEAIREVVNAHD